MRDSNLVGSLIFGKFKWYRKRRGGHWIKIPSDVGTYWVNRKPYSFEIRNKEVIAEEYWEVKK